MTEHETFFKPKRDDRPKPRQPLPVRSKRRKAEDKVYKVWRDEQLELRPYCEIRGEDCTGRSTQIHHRRRTSSGGARMLVANTVALCWADHLGPHGVHRNVAESREAGWLVGVGDPGYEELGERNAA